MPTGADIANSFIGEWTVSRGWSRRRALVATAGVCVSFLLPRWSRSADALVGTLAGDGVKNDLPEIERLLAQVEARGRGTVKLPVGRFLLNSGSRQTAITLPANVHLEGAGRDRTTLIMAPGTQGHVINAPFGWVRVADLTIDGNADKRIGRVGHNLRFEGDNITVERVRLINSASYGIGVGQRRFARDVRITDVEIVNAGNDGIDLKNSLLRTERILIEAVLVRGFGRPDSKLAPALIGSREDRMRGKAAVDLRGRECVVRELRIVGIRPGRDGLRFRHGEAGDPTGAGAHGGTASNVRIEGNGEGQGIAVIARDVRLSDVNIRNTRNLLLIAADNTSVERGEFRSASGAAIFARKTPFSRPERILIESVKFFAPRNIVLDDIKEAKFHRCEFTNCQTPIDQKLSRNSRVALTECRFHGTCKG